MLLVIIVSSVGAGLCGLQPVEQIRRVHPLVAAEVDVDFCGVELVANYQSTFRYGFADDGVVCAGVFEDLLHAAEVGCLDYNARILAKQCAAHVVVLHAEVNAALHVGKTHLQQRNDDTARRNVVSCQYKSLIYKRLHGVEGFAERLGTCHIGTVVAQSAQDLRKTRSAQRWRRVGEVYIYKCGFGNVLDVGCNNLLDVAHLAGCRDDYRAGRHYLLAVGIFLGHRERILAGGDVDAECNCKFACSLHSRIQAGVFALVFAGPHPVGTQGDGVDSILQRGKDNVGQRLGYCHP